MTTSSETRIFDIVKADRDKGLEEMRGIIAREMFRSSPELFRSYRTTPSWIQRMFRRVRSYLSTLWLALRGVDLREDTDDNY